MRGWEKEREAKEGRYDYIAITDKGNFIKHACGYASLMIFICIVVNSLRMKRIGIKILTKLSESNIDYWQTFYYYKYNYMHR